jgi:hypothetical protein
MAIAVEPAAGDGPLDVTGGRPRFHRDRVAERAARRAFVTLVAVGRPRRPHERLIAGHDDVGDAVRGGPEVGVRPSRRAGVGAGAAADEVDVGGGTGVERRAADVEVPPVGVGKDLTPAKRSG